MKYQIRVVWVVYLLLLLFLLLLLLLIIMFLFCFFYFATVPLGKKNLFSLYVGFLETERLTFVLTFRKLSEEHLACIERFTFSIDMPINLLKSEM